MSYLIIKSSSYCQTGTSNKANSNKFKIEIKLVVERLNANRDVNNLEIRQYIQNYDSNAQILFIGYHIIENTQNLKAAYIQNIQNQICG